MAEREKSQTKFNKHLLTIIRTDFIMALALRSGCSHFHFYSHCSQKKRHCLSAMSSFGVPGRTRTVIMNFCNSSKLLYHVDNQHNTYFSSFFKIHKNPQRLKNVPSMFHQFIIIMSTHTGRRSFICNALGMGISPQVLMK